MSCRYCPHCKSITVRVDSSKEYQKLFDDDDDSQYGCICPKCKKLICCMCV